MTMTMIRLWPAFALAASLLVGCGGGGGGGDKSPPATQSAALSGPLGDPVTQTVGAAGGTVSATTLGVKVRLSVPAGAVARDTVIKVTPQLPAAGEWVSLKLEPSGVFFAKPVTVVLELPSGVVPTATSSLLQRFGSADSYTATHVDVTARTLSATLTTFGGAALDVLPQPAATRSGRSHAMNATAQANPVAPADSLLTAQPNTPLADLIASIRRQVAALENVGDFDGAFALQASIASLLNRRGDVDFPVTGTPFLSEAHDTACLALRTALADASAAQPTTVAEFKPLRQKIGYWWVIAGQTDINNAGCPGANIDEFSAAAIDLTRRELVVQRLELGKIKVTENPLKLDKLRQSARDARIARRFKLEVEILQDAATNLDLPPLPPQQSGGAQAASVRPMAVRDSGYSTIIQTELLDPLVAPAREAAWQMATSTNSLAQYPELIDAFGPTPSLQQDAQYVRTRIAVSSQDTQGATIGSATLGFDSVPELPADPVKSAALRVTPGGRLVLNGSVASLECTNQGNESLAVSFENVQVASVSGSAGTLLAGALANLDPAQLLQAAGLPADDIGTHTLRIRRRTPCAAAVGLNDDLLATVELDFAPAPLVEVYYASIGETDTLLDSNVWVGACPGPTRSLGVTAVDLSMPFQFSAAPCGGHSSTMTVKQPTSTGLVFALDRLGDPSSFSGGDYLDMNVTYPRAGTVTMTISQNWIGSGAACGSPVLGSRTLAYFSVALFSVESDTSTHTVMVGRCFQAASYPTTETFPVAAGQKVKYGLRVSAIGAFSGSGDLATIEFTPAP